jgi:hypothetical protein
MQREAATHVASQATLSLFTEGRTLALEELKYGFESWRQTPAIEGKVTAQLFQKGLKLARTGSNFV